MQFLQFIEEFFIIWALGLIFQSESIRRWSRDQEASSKPRAPTLRGESGQLLEGGAPGRDFSFQLAFDPQSFDVA